MDTTPFIQNHSMFSCGDHPGKVSMVSFTDVRSCNLKCKSCHNRETVNKTGEVMNFLDSTSFEKDLSDGILLGSDLFVVSGGEPSLHYQALIPVIRSIKGRIPVRVDTNGQSPKAVVALLEFVDGFAVDIKIPLKLVYTGEDTQRFQEILGIEDIENYRDNLIETIALVDGMKFTLFRTVKYPDLLPEDIDCINDFVSRLKSKHYWNDYIVV